MEEAWRSVAPGLEKNTPIYPYAPDTSGPEEVERVTPPGAGKSPAWARNRLRSQARPRKQELGPLSTKVGFSPDGTAWEVTSQDGGSVR